MGDEGGSSTASAAPLLGGFKKIIPVPIKIVPKAFGQWAADGWSQNDKLKQKVRWRDDSSSAGGREPESPLVIGT